MARPFSKKFVFLFCNFYYLILFITKFGILKVFSNFIFKLKVSYKQKVHLFRDAINYLQKTNTSGETKYVLYSILAFYFSLWRFFLFCLILIEVFQVHHVFLQSTDWRTKYESNIAHILGVMHISGNIKFMPAHKLFTAQKNNQNNNFIICLYLLIFILKLLCFIFGVKRKLRKSIPGRLHNKTFLSVVLKLE